LRISICYQATKQAQMSLSSQNELRQASGGQPVAHAH
jgi:hypothetical protein